MAPHDSADWACWQAPPVSQRQKEGMTEADLDDLAAAAAVLTSTAARGISVSLSLNSLPPPGVLWHLARPSPMPGSSPSAQDGSTTRLMWSVSRPGRLVRLDLLGAKI